MDAKNSQWGEPGGLVTESQPKILTFWKKTWKRVKGVLSPFRGAKNALQFDPPEHDNGYYPSSNVPGLCSLLNFPQSDVSPTLSNVAQRISSLSSVAMSPVETDFNSPEQGTTSATSPFPIADQSDHHMHHVGDEQKPGLLIAEITPASDLGYQELKNPVRNIIISTKSGQKIPQRMLMDTGTKVNLMAKSLQEEAGFELEPCEDLIYPFESIPFKPIGIVRMVPWHFAKMAKTYYDDWYIVETEQIDTLLSMPCMEKHRLLYIKTDSVPAD